MAKYLKAVSLLEERIKHGDNLVNEFPPERKVLIFLAGNEASNTTIKLAKLYISESSQ